MPKVDLGEIWVVYRKDMIEFFRDYRSLLVMIVVPVILYPLFLILPAIVASKIKTEIFERNSTVAVVGDYGSLIGQLSKSKSLSIKKGLSVDESMMLLEKGKIDLIVKFPDNFSVMLESSDEVPEVKLIFNNKKELSLVSATHIHKILRNIKNKILKDRLQDQKLELPTQYNLSLKEIELKPEYTQVSSPITKALPFLQKDTLVSDPIRKVVPFLLFTMVLVAISYPAIDIITGERERKSLQILLLTPTRRRNVMIAKLLMVSTCGLGTIFLGLLSIYFTFTYASRFQSELQFTFSGLAIVYCMITSIPLVFSLSALAVYLASWCKTFQQGQGYFVPFLLFVMAGTGVCSMPNLHLSSGIAFIPILNTALGIKEFLSGSPDWLWQVVTFIVSMVFALLLTWQSSKILDREDLMFDMDKPKEARWKESDYAIEVGILALAAFLLMFYLGQSFQQWDMSYGSILTQLFVILAPSLLILKYVGRLSKTTLSLTKPKPLHLVSSVLLAPLCILIAFVVHFLQNLVFPAPEIFTTIFTKLIVQPDKPFFVVAFAIAFCPAVCEELMFRGAILGLVKKRFGTLNSILFVGVLFGLFHLSVFRILPTAVLGFILTAVTIYSGSILPAMIIHFINNFCALLITRYNMEESIVQYWPFALGVGLVGLFIFLKSKPAEITAENTYEHESQA